jgi:hypothetical protein
MQHSRFKNIRQPGSDKSSGFPAVRFFSGASHENANGYFFVHTFNVLSRRRKSRAQIEAGAVETPVPPMTPDCNFAGNPPIIPK